MKRRDFLRNIACVGAGALLLPELFLLQAAEAAWQADEPFAGLNVRRTNLRFGTLENRLRTDAIVLHHIGCTDADVSAEMVHQWHLSNGWAGLGYHFMIRKDGTIEQGRPMGMVGAHSRNENGHTVGVNLVGNFEISDPSPAQLESTAKLLAAICRRYGFAPAVDTILGHRDLNATLCPGRNLYAELPELVAKASALYVPGADRPAPETGEDTRSLRDRLHGAYSHSTGRRVRQGRKLS